MELQAREGPSLRTTEACKCVVTLRATESPMLPTERCTFVAAAAAVYRAIESPWLDAVTACSCGGLVATTIP